MRVAPALEQSSGTDYYRSYGNANLTGFTNFTLNSATTNGCELRHPSSRGQGNSTWVRSNANASRVQFSAEL